MVKVRAVFEKKGRAKYISHLDLNRCIQRTIKRSGLPIWYTEGFNPHIYIMFALPLSLGYESSAEIMDFNLTENISYEEIKERLNSVMPEGIRVLKAFESVNKHTSIKYAEYRICFKSDFPDRLINSFNEFISRDSLNTVKRTKKGVEKVVDLKPLIKVRKIELLNGILEIEALFPAGTENNINPSLLIDMFLSEDLGDTTVSEVERTGVLMENEKEFF